MMAPFTVLLNVSQLPLSFLMRTEKMFIIYLILVVIIYLPQPVTLWSFPA